VITPRVRIHQTIPLLFAAETVEQPGLGGCCGSRRSGLGGGSRRLAVAGVFFLRWLANRQLQLNRYWRESSFRLGLGGFRRVYSGVVVPVTHRGSLPSSGLLFGEVVAPLWSVEGVIRSAAPLVT